MRTIYKYEIPIKDEAVVLMPIDSQFLKFAMQDGKLCVWALVDTEDEMTDHHFRIFGTGHELPIDCDYAWTEEGDFDYCGTVFDRQFVWHIFSKH